MSCPSAEALAPHQKSSTLLLMAAGAEAGEVAHLWNMLTVNLIDAAGSVSVLAGICDWGVKGVGVLND